MVPFTTVIAAIVFGMWSMVEGSIDIYQGIILALLVLLTTTSVINDYRMSNKFEKYFEDLETQLDNNSIEKFDTVDICAEEIKHIISRKTHNIIMISLDTKIRTANPQKSNVMHNTLKSVFSNKDITLTYITLLRKDTALNLLRNIDAGDLHKRDNIYGYINDEKMIPFATFLVIDNKYVVTRSPYDVGYESHYIIVRNDVLA